MGHIESWQNNKTLIHQSEYDGLEEHQKEGKYSSEQIESYFILFESLLAPQVKIPVNFATKQAGFTN